MPFTSENQRKAFFARKKSGQPWRWPRKKKSVPLKSNGRGLLLRDR